VKKYPSAEIQYVIIHYNSTSEYTYMR